MKRTTIDYGIDLGTTNSSIAVFNGSYVEVIDNNLNQKLTPSSIWINREGRLYVGQRSKDRLEIDPRNAYSKWKPNMGKSDIFYDFENSGRKMSPEELSAEILKALRKDVKRRKDENINGAVITVPADFKTNQVDATKKAADLAGIKVCEILQEPIAAALAYGFEKKQEKGVWMVCDFGGGTFDVAIIRMHEGDLSVTDHGGDTNLGGELIDWDIVERILVPALMSRHPLKDFHRGNFKWIQAFAKLKLEAEKAKIDLSQEVLSEIYIDRLCEGEDGEQIDFEFKLSRDHLEPILAPYVERTINICKDVLAQARLSPGDVQKMILVGGPTLTPFLRESLKDRLRIPLEFGIDPLTVVAQGAAIYAASKMIEMPVDKTEPGSYLVKLESYSPMGPSLEPLVMGKVTSTIGEITPGHTLEFIEVKSQWHSGKIPLQSKGVFKTKLRAEDGRRNNFRIELRDSAGDLCKTDLGEIQYTVGITPRSSLVHSLGVALADNSFLVLLNKRMELPAERTETLRTTVGVKKGQSGEVIRIPILEGENIKRADRNTLVGTIEIKGENVANDLPLGSEVEIKLRMNESRLVRANAWVPSCDQEFDIEVRLGSETEDFSSLASQMNEEIRRMDRLKDQSNILTDSPESSQRFNEIIQRIIRERLLEDIESMLLRSQRGDKEASNQCQERLRMLKEYLDQASDELQWPIMVSKTREMVNYTQAIIESLGGSEIEMREFTSMKNSAEEAIKAHDQYALQTVCDRLAELGRPLIVNSMEYLQIVFSELIEYKSKMIDPVAAEGWIKEGQRSIYNRDINGLRVVLAHLVELLPSEVEVDKISEVAKSTVRRE